MYNLYIDEKRIKSCITLHGAKIAMTKEYKKLLHYANCIKGELNTKAQEGFIVYGDPSDYYNENEYVTVRLHIQ